MAAADGAGADDGVAAPGGRPRRPRPGGGRGLRLDHRAAAPAHDGAALHRAAQPASGRLPEGAERAAGHRRARHAQNARRPAGRRRVRADPAVPPDSGRPAVGGGCQRRAGERPQRPLHHPPGVLHRARDHHPPQPLLRRHDHPARAPACAGGRASARRRGAQGGNSRLHGAQRRDRAALRRADAT